MKIKSVLDIPQLHGRTIYRIRTDSGERFSTDNMFVAGLCQRAKDLDRDVTIMSSAGWFDRRIRHIAFEGSEPMTWTA